MSRKLSALLLSSLILASLAAEAKTTTFSSNPNIPAYGSTGLIYTLGARAPASRYQFIFDTDYANEPLGGRPFGPYVDHLLTHNLGFTYSPNDFFQMDAVLPIVSYNRFSTPLSLTKNFSNKAGLGDLLFRIHLNVLKNESGNKGLSLIPYMTMPFGNENHYISDKYPRGGLIVAVDWRLSDRWYSAVNLGLEGRQEVDLFDYELKGRWLASAGLAYKVNERLTVNSDLVTSTALDKPFKSKASSPVELMGGADIGLKNHPITFNINGGGSLVRAATAPIFRVQAGVTYAFGSADRSPESVREERVERPVKAKSASRASSRSNRFGNPSESELAALQPTIGFPKKSTRLSKDDKAALDRVAALLNKYPKLNLVIAQEHFDARRGKKKQKAGLVRANAVKSYLVSRQVSEGRLSIDIVHGKKRNVFLKAVK